MRPGRVQRGLHLGHHRRPQRLPAVLLVAHPLHAHRLARHGAGDQRGVGRGVVGAVMAVAAGALDMDAAHLRVRHAQHLGDGVAVGEHALGMRPDRHRAVQQAARRRRTGRSSRASGTAAYSARSASSPRRPAGSAGPARRCPAPAARSDGRRCRPAAAGRHPRSCHCAAAARARIALIAWNSLLCHHREEVAVAHHLPHARQLRDARRCRRATSGRRDAAAAPPGHAASPAAACPARRPRRR